MIRAKSPTCTALFTLPGHNQSLSHQKRKEAVNPLWCNWQLWLSNEADCVLTVALPVWIQQMRVSCTSKCYCLISKYWVIINTSQRKGNSTRKHILSSLRWQFEVLNVGVSTDVLEKCNKNENKLALQIHALYLIFLLPGFFVSFWQLQYHLLFCFNERVGGVHERLLCILWRYSKIISNKTGTIRHCLPWNLIRLCLSKEHLNVLFSLK